MDDTSMTLTPTAHRPGFGAEPTADKQFAGLVCAATLRDSLQAFVDAIDATEPELRLPHRPTFYTQDYDYGEIVNFVRGG
jgi:hypothetical protein